jgi:hypothetical protein
MALTEQQAFALACEEHGSAAKDQADYDRGDPGENRRLLQVDGDEGSGRCDDDPRQRRGTSNRTMSEGGSLLRRKIS